MLMTGITSSISTKLYLHICPASACHSALKQHYQHPPLANPSAVQSPPERAQPLVHNSIEPKRSLARLCFPAFLLRIKDIGTQSRISIRARDRGDWAPLRLALIKRIAVRLSPTLMKSSARLNLVAV